MPGASYPGDPYRSYWVPGCLGGEIGKESRLVRCLDFALMWTAGWFICNQSMRLNHSVTQLVSNLDCVESPSTRS